MADVPRGYTKLWALRSGTYAPLGQNVPTLEKLQTWFAAGRIDLKHVDIDHRTTIICAKNLERK